MFHLLDPSLLFTAKPAYSLHPAADPPRADEGRMQTRVPFLRQFAYDNMRPASVSLKAGHLFVRVEAGCAQRALSANAKIEKEISNKNRTSECQEKERT